MKAEDKDLLIKDLCGRLPYGVEMHHIADDEHSSTILIGIVEDMIILQDIYDYTYTDVEDYRPYLFPLSSMTEEQKKEFYDKYCWSDGGDNFEMDSCSHYYALEKFDWLNKNHFDYRGLIKKGLAIDCSNLNIY